MNASLRRVAVAAVAFGVTGLLAVPTALAGDTAVQADAHCNTDNTGVVDITLINDGQSASTFVVEGASHRVEAGSAYALTFTGVSDGAFVLPITADGADATVRLSVQCAPTRVAVAPGEVESYALPATGDETAWGLVVGGGLVAVGVAVSLLARRRYG